MAVQTGPRRSWRAVIRLALTIVGIAGGLVCYFVCQGMFAGYPKYHSALLSTVGMILISAVGGAAWIVDERRSHDDD